MNEQFLRLAEIIARTGLSKRTIYARMAAGTFPRSVKIGPNSVAWRASDIAAWMAAPAQWRSAA